MESFKRRSFLVFIHGVLFLCLVSPCVGIGSWDNACHQSIVSQFDDSDHLATLSLNKDCANGTVDWHYPQGALHLSYDKGDNSKKFIFCMVESWVTYHGNFTDLTGGRNQEMAMPTIDRPSCISSSHGKVLVSVAALSDNMYYMTSMGYAVTTHH